MKRIKLLKILHQTNPGLHTIDPATELSPQSASIGIQTTIILLILLLLLDHNPAIENSSKAKFYKHQHQAN